MRHSLFLLDRVLSNCVALALKGMCKYLIYYHKLIIVAQSMYERYYRQEKKEKTKN
jgi:hypothetical protein